MTIRARKIEHPTDLVDALRDIRAAVANGQLKQIWKPDAICGTEETLDQIPDAGPWLDYLELYFVDPSTGSEYKLSAETYHGTGGTLEQI